MRAHDRGDWPFEPLIVERGQLYFESDKMIRRLDLGSDEVTDIVSARQVDAIAIGGGWLYWKAFGVRKLHRHRLGR